MTRKTIVLTGASDGIGAAAARRLHRSGANVVLVGRSERKAAALAAELKADYFVADFADLSQVRALADKIRSEHPRIDVLGNNAGGVFSRLHETADGHEITLQVNYLAPFLLTTLLLDVLVVSRATIINTSSSSQRLLRNVTLTDFDATGRRRPSTAYALAKLANIMFTRELHRRYHADGLSAAVVHPGFVNTNIGHSSGSRFLTTMQCTPVSRLIKTPDRGADQLVWLASSTPASTGLPASTTRRAGSRGPTARPTIPCSRASCGIAPWPSSLRRSPDRAHTRPPRIPSIPIGIHSILTSMLLAMSSVKPRRTRPTRDEVRDRIVDAASKVFAAEGFAGATIDAIGQAAGFTKGAVYSNFGSKDELFLALLDRQFELRGEQIATALDGSGGDIGAAARELSRSVLDTVRDHSDYYVLFVEYWLRAQRDPKLRERLIERRRAAAADQALHIVGSNPSLASDRELADVAQLVVTINLGIAMEEILRPGAIDPDLLARLITAALESVPVSAD